MARKKYTVNLPFSEIAQKMMAILGFKHYVDLAKFLEITPQSINKFRVENRFPTNLVVKFAFKNKSSLDELLGEFLNIPSAKAKGERIVQGNGGKKGMELGSQVSKGEESDVLTIRYIEAKISNIQKIIMEVSKSWVQEHFGDSRNDLSLWIMKSDNMTPTIERNSLLLIDYRSDSIKGGGIYAFKGEDKVMIMRVQERLNATLDIVNDNRAYESYSIKAQDLSEGGLKVLGRVVFVGKPI